MFTSSSNIIITTKYLKLAVTIALSPDIESSKSGIPTLTYEGFTSSHYIYT